MIDVMIIWPLWLLLGALLFVAWWGLRVRFRNAMRPRSPVVDDDAMRRIVEEGRLTTDEDDPLDMDEIRRRERDFWAEERWDEAEGLDL